jgi:hypothetical protein
LPKTLTQADVDRAKRNHNRPIAATAVSLATTPPTAADTSSEAPQASQYHHVVVIMGMSSNPIAYMVSNASNVFEASDSGSESEQDTLTSVSSVSTVISSPASCGHATSPLHVPHLYWHCLTSGKGQEFPLIFEALIDHSSSTVLIRESYVNDLGLHRKLLRTPLSAELAMENNGQKIKVDFTEYVTLQLHDPSALWSSKSVHAIVAHGLCAPMILGMPFLSHNNIVVDASAHSAVDKKSGFDLLNPMIPKAPILKKKLKDFYKELKAD